MTQDCIIQRLCDNGGEVVFHCVNGVIGAVKLIETRRVPNEPATILQAVLDLKTPHFHGSIRVQVPVDAASADVLVIKEENVPKHLIFE